MFDDPSLALTAQPPPRPIDAFLGSLAQVVTASRSAIGAIDTAFAAEIVASAVLSGWHRGRDPATARTRAAFGNDVVAAIERDGDDVAVATLRALACVWPNGQAGPAAHRLTRRGVDEPVWRAALGLAWPVVAYELEDLGEEGADETGLVIEFTHADGPPHALITSLEPDGTATYYAIGFRMDGDDAAPRGGREIALTEAARRLQAAVLAADRLPESLLSEASWATRGVVTARLKALDYVM